MDIKITIIVIIISVIRIRMIIRMRTIMTIVKIT